MWLHTLCKPHKNCVSVNNCQNLIYPSLLCLISHTFFSLITTRSWAFQILLELRGVSYSGRRKFERVGEKLSVERKEERRPTTNAIHVKPASSDRIECRCSQVYLLLLHVEFDEWAQSFSAFSRQKLVCEQYAKIYDSDEALEVNPFFQGGSRNFRWGGGAVQT